MRVSAFQFCFLRIFFAVFSSCVHAPLSGVANDARNYAFRGVLNFIEPFVDFFVGNVYLFDVYNLEMFCMGLLNLKKYQS